MRSVIIIADPSIHVTGTSHLIILELNGKSNCASNFHTSDKLIKNAINKNLKLVKAENDYLAASKVLTSSPK